ncbi:MAG TPA: hypothetical protein VFT74_00785, partial [Isosphaeraceae bacterium]|nr:hypothetical protein [Isosphaeraceae bacterium]
MIRKPADRLISTNRQQGTKPTSRDQLSPSQKTEDRANPKTRNRRTRTRVETGFEAFSAEIRQEFEAHGTLETLLVDIVVTTGWDLKQGRGSASNFLKAIETLNRLRGHRTVPANTRLSIPAPEPEPMSDPARSERLDPRGLRRQTTTTEEISPAESTHTDPTTIDARWRDRLLLDPEVSDVSPVIRGT